jgi:hypothetical protein
MSHNTTEFLAKEKALEFLAIASIKQKKIYLNTSNLSSEMARIDRIITESYTKSKDVIEYNKYVMDFIKCNGRAIVYNEEYDYDIDLPDNRYDLNIDVVIDKLLRKEFYNNLTTPSNPATMLSQ